MPRHQRGTENTIHDAKLPEGVTLAAGVIAVVVLAALAALQ
jgi:hypothetical protein